MYAAESLPDQPATYEQPGNDLAAELLAGAEQARVHASTPAAYGPTVVGHYDDARHDAASATQLRQRQPGAGEYEKGVILSCLPVLWTTYLRIWKLSRNTTC